MPNILIIAQAAPPNGGSHATRLTYFIKELAELGWSVEVLTTKIYPGTPLVDNSMLEDIPGDVSFIRSFPGPLHRWAYRNKKVTNKITKKVTKSGWKKKILLPDTYIEWLPYAVSDILFKKKLKQKPDIILSSAVPYTSHLIALILKKKWNIPWVADYGDPWVYDPGNPRTGLRYIIEKWLESMVISNANVISLTTDTTKELYIEKYRIDENKIKVVPMGFDSKDFIIPEFVNISGKTRFLYTGRLEPESRDANLFFLALKSLYVKGKLHNCIFEFIGTFHNDIIQLVNNLGLSDIIKFHEWMDHKECMKYLVTVDFLLLFGNNNNIQIPGKTFNYIGSGTPIIYLSNYEGENDPVKKILEDSGLDYWCVDNNQFSIEKILIEINENYNTSNPKRPDQSYSWNSRVKDLSCILKDLL
ncbi:glycosyltransferase [Paenibacillus sp. 19GGS1-52]|uniref:glycosyltransferase n=1 Tax=Paenibacillus sp. 19GGS1-52 TaxID=2758563 RepID=UPI001EFAADFF|nr:glycosyltransferase [Paenibacillus sp. 19GGS1-52]ULO08644.1 glycosyltransferase [Paenibacillus sp. 19GGS1-52]